MFPRRGVSLSTKFTQGAGEASEIALSDPGFEFGVVSGAVPEGKTGLGGEGDWQVAVMGNEGHWEMEEGGLGLGVFMLKQ